MRTIALLAALLMAGPAIAQQQKPDPAALQRIINSLEGQRNKAANEAALAEARAAELGEEVSRARAEIEALKKAATKKQEPEQ